MPLYARRNVEEFARLNPEYRLMIHNEKAVAPHWRTMMEAAEDMATKSDLVRISVLRAHGGWYMDSDIWPLRPLDDAVRAWGLTGDKLYVSRQRGHMGGEASPYANGILACGTGAPALDLLAGMIDEMPIDKPGRCQYGPPLMRQAIETDKRLFTIGAAGWWFPLTIAQTMVAVPYLLAGRIDELRAMRAHTDGQIPFGAHLWASHRNIDLEAAYQAPVRDIRRALVEKVSVADHPLNHISIGLNRLGFEVDRGYRSAEDCPIMVDPDLIVTWNGKKFNNPFGELSQETGIPTLFVEHGFFQRREYSQVDHRGILHWASWADRLRHEDAPAEGYERLSRFYPDGIPERGGDPNGYILILGQVAGDTQLADSPFSGAPEMLQKVCRCIPQGIQAVFRPHPQAKRIDASRHQYYRPVEIQRLADDSAKAYHHGMQAPDLAETLAGARFCVAINSNALVEAVAMGIPCAAFGPSLGLVAGAYRQLDTSTLAQDLQAMANGWAPRPETVRRYLAWLACRQWSKAELEDPAVVSNLLTESGIMGV